VAAAINNSYKLETLPTKVVKGVVDGISILPPIRPRGRQPLDRLPRCEVAMRACQRQPASLLVAVQHAFDCRQSRRLGSRDLDGCSGARKLQAVF
jgi:hypothetical protein